MWTVSFQMFKPALEKAEKPEIKLPTSAGSSKKQESTRKISISALFIYFFFMFLFSSPVISWNPLKILSLLCRNLLLLLRLFCCFWRQWSAFLVAWCHLPAYRSCFVEFAQRWMFFWGILWGRKWCSRPIPPPSLTIPFLLYWLYQSLWLCGWQ